MIRRIFAKNFYCLQDVDIRLDGSFHVLVGANGSGKSSFMDVIDFLSDLISLPLEEAIDKRTRDCRDLFWAPEHKNSSNLTLTLGIELEVSTLSVTQHDQPKRGCLLYSVSLSDDENQGIHISHEKVQLMREHTPTVSLQRTLSKTEYRIGNTTKKDFVLENASEVSSVATTLRRAPDRYSPLTHAFESFENLLGNRVTRILLDTRQLQRACSPSVRDLSILLPDGSNLPWLIKNFKISQPDQFNSWLDHIRTSIGEIRDVRVIETDEDGRGYIKIRFDDGAELPAWCVSAGTLRLMALTALAYLPHDEPHVFMIEEPENGLHPLAIETVHQSLSSIYDSHVFLTSHSPLLLRCSDPKDVLCFRRLEDGSIRIIKGEDHPSFANETGDVEIDQLFTHDNCCDLVHIQS